MSELTDHIEEYREEYEVDSSVEVNILKFDAGQIDDVYVGLDDWTRVMEERRLYERARRKTAGSSQCWS